MFQRSRSKAPSDSVTILPRASGKIGVVELYSWTNYQLADILTKQYKRTVRICSSTPKHEEFEPRKLSDAFKKERMNKRSVLCYPLLNDSGGIAVQVTFSSQSMTTTLSIENGSLFEGESEFENLLHHTDTKCSPLKHQKNSVNKFYLAAAWLQIGKSILLVRCQDKENPIFLNISGHCVTPNCFRAFSALASVPVSYIQHHKASLKGPKKKAVPLLIPYGRFTKMIIYYVGSTSNVHRRPESPRHLPGDDFLLGNLKFIPKGETDEVFGMEIPKPLITEAIQQSSYYPKYLEMVAKNTKKTPQDKVSFVWHQEKGGGEGADADLNEQLSLVGSFLSTASQHRYEQKVVTEALQLKLTKKQDEVAIDHSHIRRRDICSLLKQAGSDLDKDMRIKNNVVRSAPRECSSYDISSPNLLHRVCELEQDMSEVKKTNHSAAVLASIQSQVPTVVDKYLGTKLCALLESMKDSLQICYEILSVAFAPES
ncbi:hypothetical protein Tco_1157116 [Tanacetum coccineum]